MVARIASHLLSSGSLSALALLLVVIAFVFARFASRLGRTGVSAVLDGAIIAVVLASVMSVVPRPLADQPFPDAQEIADATRQLVSGNGYVTYVHGNERHPPRYSPGFSLALAPFAMFGDDYPANVQRGATFYAALYVLLAAIAAWSLKGPTAGALAAILIGVSPFARAEASLIMSDALAAGATVLLVTLVQRPAPRRVSWASALAGALVVIRLPMVLNLIALFVVLPNALRKRMFVFAAPSLIALALFHWAVFGSPLRTGYDYWLPNAKQFSAAFALASPITGDGPWIVADVLRGLLLQGVCPCPVGGPQAAMSNLFYYGSILLGLFWIYVPPFISLIGLLYAWQNRHAIEVRFAICVVALHLVFFLFYFYQGARFMAAPATLLAVLACAKLATWIDGERPTPSR